VTYSFVTKTAEPIVDHAEHTYEEWHAYLSGADLPSWVLGSDTGICCHTCETIIVDQVIGLAADGEPIVDGLVVFTNDMKVGKVVGKSLRPYNPGWFDVAHLDGTTSFMNAERVSTTFRTYKGKIEHATEKYEAQKGANA